MNKIIQVKGSNATGKTTTIRQFIENHNLRKEAVKVESEDVPIYANNEHTICILGDYEAKNGGCDRFKGKKQIYSTIKYLIKSYNSKYIIFEGFIYGKSLSFAEEMLKFSRLYNYEYLSVFLFRKPQSALNLLYKRNGNNSINEKSFFSSYKMCLSCYKKSKERKMLVKAYDVDNIDLAKMGSILEEALWIMK